MRYGYFPGCALHCTAKEYDLSIRLSCPHLDLELVEVPDWSCCGASPGHMTSEELALALSVRNLYQAERHDLTTVIAPCAACYSRLKSANKEVGEDARLMSRINRVVGEEYAGKVEVRHLIEVLYKDVGLSRIESSVTKPLEGMKFACYYGCLLTRPPKVADFDDVENPIIMDRIVEALGAEPVSWSHKTECCGAGFSITRPEIAVRLVDEILKAAQFAAADSIVVACPLCHANLDMRQSQAKHKYGRNYNIPILYISQVIGLAQGEAYKALGLDKHLVSPGDLLKEGLAGF